MRFDDNRIFLSRSCWGRIQVLRDSPKGGVGSPTGFARGAGARRAIPRTVGPGSRFGRSNPWALANRHLPETTLISKATN